MSNKSLEITAGSIIGLTGKVKDSYMIHYFRDNGGSGSPTDLSLYGSLNGENFKLIKTYSAETLETLTTWYPVIAVTTGTDAVKTSAGFSSSDNFGDSQVFFYEDISS